MNNPNQSDQLVKTNWSIALEHEEYDENRELVIQDALQAVERTASGYSVNLVTPAVWGNPEQYLTPVLKEKFGQQFTVKFVDQCGCGGYVLRVYK